MDHDTGSLDPKMILEVLAEPAQMLREGLDDGISFADVVMDSQPPDPHVWAMLVRYRACNVIKPKAKKKPWTFRKLTNCGLEFQVGTYQVRALRTLYDNPPNPGRNKARRQFYSQYHQYHIPFDGPASSAIGANLILDWTTGAKRTILMALSKPLGFWNYKKQPNIEWRKPIEFGHDNTPRFAGSDEDTINLPPKYDEGEFDAGGEAE